MGAATLSEAMVFMMLSPASSAQVWRTQGSLGVCGRTRGVMAIPSTVSSHAMASIVLAFLELPGRAALVIVHTGSLGFGKRKSSQP